MSGSPPRRRYAWTTVALLLPYAALNTAFPGPAVTYGGGLVIAIAALPLCLRCGLTRGQLLLVPATASSQSVALFTVSAVVALPALAVTGRLAQSIGPSVALAAIASAAGQELYFRGAFLGLLRHGFALAPRRAVLLQAAVFSAWHSRAYLEVAPELATIVVGLSFFVGAAGAALAMRDGTLLWVVAVHAGFLVAA